jgi:hypothetical protein
MSRNPRDAWIEWLEAEKAGAADRADMALREAFAVLPRRAPTAALHGRLIGITAISRGPARGRSEAWVAAGLVLAALGLTAAPLGIIAGFFLISPGRVVSGVAQACVWLTEWLNAGASIWALLGRTGSALGHAAVTPTGSSLLTVALLVASMALLALNRYLPVERSET